MRSACAGPALRYQNAARARHARDVLRAGVEHAAPAPSATPMTVVCRSRARRGRRAVKRCDRVTRVYARCTCASTAALVDSLATTLPTCVESTTTTTTMTTTTTTRKSKLDMDNTNPSFLILLPSTRQPRGSSPNTRQRAEHNPNFDTDATPRPFDDMVRPPVPSESAFTVTCSTPSRLSAGRSSPTKATGRSSTASGSSSKPSSPVKTLAAFTFAPTPIRVREFGDRDDKTATPAAPKKMLTKIRR